MMYEFAKTIFTFQNLEAKHSGNFLEKSILDWVSHIFESILLNLIFIRN